MNKQPIPSLHCPHCNTVGDVATIMKSNQLTAWCKECGCFIKNIPYETQEDAKFHFGKLKGTKIANCGDIGYMKWYLSLPKHSFVIRSALEARINQLETIEYKSGFNKDGLPK